MRKIEFSKILLERILIFLVVILSLVYFRYNWNLNKNEKVAVVLQIARSIEATLPKEDIKVLEAKAGDLDKPQYHNLKNRLKAIIRVNKEARFAYLYTLKNNKILFLADSEPEDSKDYSPPGQELVPADLSYYQYFTDGEEFVTEPFTDRWGRWSSVLIPVKDEDTGKIIAVFGMDFNAGAWKARLLYELAESSTLMLLLLTTLLFLLKIRTHTKLLLIEIKERKSAELELQFRNILLATQHEALIEGVLVVDENKNIISYNHRFIEMWDIPPALIEDGNDERALEYVTNLVADPQSFLRRVRYLYDHKQLTSRDEIVLKSGSIFDRFSSPMVGPHDRYYGRIWSFHDISEHKQVVDELIRAKEHAEESDRLKSAFLANMSHEIRTPMNGIIGFAGLLKEPKLSGEEQFEYIGIIEKSGARMLNIINDIMSISKVESGQMDVSVKETNINDQIQYIYTFFKPEAELKGIRLTVEKLLPDKEAIIRTDKEKVYAILTNLVKNAIKFTHTGSIEFGYNLKPVHPDSDHFGPKKAGELVNVPAGEVELEFYVKDTGSGIRPEQQEFIFERFRQGSESLTRNYEGAGLGLAISKAYVQMLGGEIWVESNEGFGSVFYFTLPYNGIQEEKNNMKSSVSVEPAQFVSKGSELKVLIAEDDKESAMYIEKAILLISTEVLVVRNGIEAVEACRKMPDIDLVLMDIKMPVMDGYEATREIRRFNSKVIIIAQTAFALSGDREKAIESGCNDYIAKPINKAKLIGLMKKYFDL